MKREKKGKDCQSERSRGTRNILLKRFSASLEVTFVRNFILLFFILSFISCQQKIDLKLPDYTQKLVVEGKVEAGSYPQVYLTNTLPYFGGHSVNLTDLVVKGAFVTVTDGTTTDTLKEVVPGQGYFYRATHMIGTEGKTYNLMIQVNGKVYTAQTSIYPQVKLDTLWFKAEKQDSLGFIYTHMEEPPQLGNWYRWQAKRINKVTDADF